MLIPVHQQQTRFVIPGLSPDARGIVLGPRLVVLLPSLDRVIAVIAVLSTELRSEDLFAGLCIHRVRSALGGLDFLLVMQLRDPHLIDRVAAAASLHGGEVLIGEALHYVRYRDRRSPLGYDVDRLAALPEAGPELEADAGPDADAPERFFLYGRVAEGSYCSEETHSLRSLLLRIPARPRRRAPEDDDLLLLLVRRGLRQALDRVLWRHRCEGRVARIETVSAPGGSSDGERYLYELRNPPPTLGALLDRTPGFELFVPEGEFAAVERGQVHPIDLAACAPALEGGGLHLFRGGHRPALVIAEPPAWLPLSVGLVPTVVGAALPLTPVPMAKASGVDLRLVARPAERAVIAGVFVPCEQLPLFRHLVYFLPPSALERYRAIAVEAGVFVIAKQGPVEELPVGVPLREAAPSVYVPVGSAFRPQVSEEVITEALQAQPGRRVVFVDLESPPLLFTGTFQALGRGFLDVPEAVASQAISGPEQRSPTVIYPRVGPFPLWDRSFPAAEGGEDDR